MLRQPGEAVDVPRGGDEGDAVASVGEELG